MRLGIVSLFSLFLIMCVASLAYAATHSRVAEFDTIRASHSEIAQLVSRVRAFVTKANFDDAEAARDDFGSESLKFSDEKAELELEQDFDVEAISAGPKAVTRVVYSYYNSSSPISQVIIELGDFDREVIVKGTAAEQVDALLALITADIRELEGGFGGYGDRALGGLVLWLLGTGVAISAAILPGVWRWIGLVGGLATQFSIWILPWSSWLPGTLVRAENISFLEKNAALITFAGLLITAISVVVSLVMFFAKRKTPDDAGKEGETEQSEDEL